ncbi:MAG: PAS domain S-box-containing protein [Crocinitomicaceae bacterium]|jgi:PAS domain S-box-containing protein
MSEQKINKAIDVLMEFSKENFSERLKIEDENSLLDALAAGINMLGEHLEASVYELNKSKSELSTIVNNLNEIVYIVEVNLKDLFLSRVQFMSPQIEQVTGLLPKNLLLDISLWSNAVHPDDRKVFDEKKRKAYNGTSVTRTYRLLNKTTQKYLWIEERLNPKKDVKNNVTHIIGIVRDVTRKKLAEEDLLQTRTKLQEVIDYSPAVFHNSKATGDFSATFISENVKQQLGYEPNDFIEDASFWASKIHPDDSERVYKDLDQLFIHGTFSHEYRFKHKNGTYIWIQDSFRLKYNEKGEPSQIVGFWLNINQRKEAELRERVINNIARSLNKNNSQKEFLFMVRKDLSTVLNAKNFCVCSYIEKNNTLDPLINVVNNKKDNSSVSVLSVMQCRMLERLIDQKETWLLSKEDLDIYNFENNKLDEVKSIVLIPLLEDDIFVGLMVLKSFDDCSLYNTKDLELLTFVGTQIGAFISRNRSEISLRKSEERNRALIQANPDVILRLDRSGEIKDFHASPGTLILPVESFIDANIRDVLSPQQGDECLSLIQSAIETEEVQLFYHDTSYKNHKYYFEGRIVKNGKDEVLNIVRNITAQKKAELLKNISHQIALKSNLEGGTIREFCTFVRDQIGQLMDVSNFYICQIEDSQSLNFILFGDNEDNEEDPIIRKNGNGLSEYIIRTGESILLNNNNIQKFHHEKGLDKYGPPTKCWIGAPLLSSGKTIGVIACQSYTENDIYNATHLELLTTIGNQIGMWIERQKAKDDQESIIHIIENSIHETFIFDAKTLKFTYVNKGAQDNLGYSLEEMYKLTAFDLKDNFTRDTFIEMIAPLVSGKIPVVQFENSHRRKNGTRYPIEVNLQYFTFKGNKVFLAMVQDITERKIAEQKRKESYLELELIDQVNQASFKNATYKELIHEILTVNQKLIPNSTLRFYSFDEITEQLILEDQIILSKAIKQLEALLGVKLNSLVPSIIESSCFYQAIHEKKTLIFQDKKSINKVLRDHTDSKVLKKLAPIARDIIKIKSMLLVPYHSENKIFGLMVLSVNEVLSKEKMNQIIRFNDQVKLALSKTKMEQEIIEEKRFMEQLLNSIPADIAVYDQNQNYVYLNSESVRNDKTRDWLIGKNDFEYAHFKGISDETAIHRRAKFKEAIAGKNDAHWVDKHITNLGSDRYMLRRLHPYFVEGKLKQVIGTGVDITKQVESEKNLEELAKTLEIKVEQRTKDLKTSQLNLEKALEKEKQLSDLKSSFVTTTSHQFRTPMAIIQSNAELLNMIIEKSELLYLKPKLEKTTARIQKEIKRMTKLMDDILILGKITSGKGISLNIEPINILEFCYEIADSYNEIQTDGRKINTKYYGQQKELNLDRKLMHHILSNLISNALKYSDTVSPEIQITFNENSTTISIIDYGIGIPENDLSDLFEPFHRAQNVGNIPGTGLGLSIVKEYVKLNRGEISIESVLNKGSTFTILFPFTEFDPPKLNGA